MPIRSTICAAVVAPLTLLPSAAVGTVLIGDWEGAADGWTDGPTAPLAPPKFTYSTGIGVTSGTRSLELTQAGPDVNLTLRLQNVGLIDEFFAHQWFSIDVTVLPSTTLGFAQLYALMIHADGYGFFTQPPAPKQTWQWDAGGSPSGPQFATLTWYYGHLIDGDASNGEIAASPAWVELMLMTNSDAAHGKFYFDNARLGSIPEPAGMAVVGGLIPLLTPARLRRK